MIRYVLLVRSMPNVITFLYVQQMSIHNKINGQTNEAWVSCGNDFPHLLKAVEKSDKKRLIQRSQILWHKRRDSEAPTLHQKKQRERERERLQTYQKRFQDSETGPKVSEAHVFLGTIHHPPPFSNLFRVIKLCS